MTNQELKIKLQELGFSRHDINVYLALIEQGPCNAGPIISATNLHRNIVYTSLNHLMTKKLASERVVNGRKRFSAANPTILIDVFNQKAATAKDVASMLMNKIKGGVQEITIHEGNEEYLNLLSSIGSSIPKGSTKYVLGTGGQQFADNTLTHIWDRYSEILQKNGTKVKMLAYMHQKKSIAPEVRKAKNYDIRYLKTDAENPAGIHIYPEAGIVLNIIYSDDTRPVTAIKIKNEALVKGYLHFFNNLWKSTK